MKNDMAIITPDSATIPSSIGIKYDDLKLEWSQLPIDQLEQVVKVYTHGARKYKSDDNWKSVENANKRYFNAAMRHIMEYGKGNKTDPEFGCSHLAHAIFNLLTLMWFDDNKGGKC